MKSAPHLTRTNCHGELITSHVPERETKPLTHDGLDPRVDSEEW
jgi:hypothetical protein